MVIRQCILPPLYLFCPLMKSGSHLWEQKQRPEVLQLSWKHPLLHRWLLWKGQYTGQSALWEEKEMINRLRNETSKGLAADQVIDTTTSLRTRMAQMYEQFVAIRQNFTQSFYHPSCHVTCACHPLCVLLYLACSVSYNWRRPYWIVILSILNSIPRGWYAQEFASPPCHSLTW